MAAIRLARHPRWAPILAVVALLNFILYVIVASSHGGDAWNGYIKNARYFVSQHGHGTEVSRTFWVYSCYHTIFLWITYLSAIVAFGFFYINALRRRCVLHCTSAISAGRCDEWPYFNETVSEIVKARLRQR